jgi:hypothetical protein
MICCATVETSLFITNNNIIFHLSSFTIIFHLS